MRKPLADLTVNDLESAYNGKTGCACGCRGTHSYLDIAYGTRRGWDLTAEDIRPRSVAYTLKMVQSHADEASEGVNNWAYQSDTRLYIVYPKASAL